MKTYNKTVRFVTARPRNKRLRDCVGTGGSGRSSGSIGGSSEVIEGHTHDNLEDLDRLSVSGTEIKVDEGNAIVYYARNANRAVSAALADVATIANGLAIALWNSLKAMFLRKDQDDETTHKLTMASTEVKGNAAVGGTLDVAGKTTIQGQLAVQDTADFQEPVVFEDTMNLPGRDFVQNAAGGKIWYGTSGNSYAQFDFLRVNQKFSVDTFEVNHTEHIGGKLVITPSYCTIHDVINGDQAYRVRFKAKDADGNVITNTWKAGDLAYCKTYDMQNGSRFWWRQVTGILDTVDSDGCYSIFVSKSICHEDSDIPQAGDYVVLLGSSITTRQGAIVLYAGGESELSPYYRVYKGISSFALPTPLKHDSPDGLEATYKTLNVIMSDGTSKSVAQIAADSSQISLLVQGFVENLLATGINITDKKILITGDTFAIQNNNGEATFKVDKYGNPSIYGAINTMKLEVTSSNFADYFSENEATGNYHLNLLNMSDVIWLSDELQDELFESGSFAIGLPAIVNSSPLWNYDYGETTDEERCASIRKLVGRKIYLYNYLGGSLHINCYGVNAYEPQYIVNSSGQLEYNCNPNNMTLILSSCRCACLELKMLRRSWAGTQTRETLYWEVYAGGQFN